jgi:hypothetical protein
VARIDDDERRARLARRHRLTREEHAPDPVQTATALVALHSTDPATVFLSARARTRRFAVADLERALYDERSLVRMLAMRRTLWVVARELVAVVHAAATRTVAARERRRLEGLVAASGVADHPSRWLATAGDVALEALAARGEAFTADLTRGNALLATKLPVGTGRWQTEVSAGSRILPLLAAEGAIARGRPRTTWLNGTYRWTPVDSWLGAPIERLDQSEAQAELLRRWLEAFGPATETDVRWWTGWTAREVRGALARIPHAVVELEGDAPGLVLAGDDEPTVPPEPWVALLPTLDPTTMGWKRRDWYVGPHERTLFDANGNAGPTVWSDGRVVGGWSHRPDGEIVVGLLEDVGSEAAGAIAEEAARLAEWLGDARLSPSFLPPFQRALAS